MNHRPRKRFGQNFLHDPGIIRRIVGAIAPRPEDHLVEIGPGLGALTEPLLESAGALDAVELDRDLIAELTRRFGDRGLRLHEADALRFDFRSLAGAGQQLRVVGNLPYNISTPLIFHLLDQVSAVRDMHFMLQKEVVDRLAAVPGTGDYSRLTVMVQYHCRVDQLFNVAPGAFNPPPKVWSSIVRLVPYDTRPATADDPARLARLVTQAFAQRRKTLRNNLKGLVGVETMERLDIDPTRRPETLSVAEFVALANASGE